MFLHLFEYNLFDFLIHHLVSLYLLGNMNWKEPGCSLNTNQWVSHYFDDDFLPMFFSFLHFNIPKRHLPKIKQVLVSFKQVMGEMWVVLFLLVMFLCKRTVAHWYPSQTCCWVWCVYIVQFNKTGEGLAEWHWKCNVLEDLVVTEAYGHKRKTPEMNCGFLHSYTCIPEQLFNALTYW